MKKLAKYLIINKSLVICNRKVRPRFFILIGILLIIVFLSAFFVDYAALLDQLLPDTYFTSVYWQTVFEE